MDSRDDIKQKIDQLAGSLERLDRAYTQYFAGAEDAGPGKLRQRVDRLARELTDATIHNTEWQFRIKRLLQRYQTFKAKWDRNLRRLERGTLSRGEQAGTSENDGDKDQGDDESEESAEQVYELDVTMPEKESSAPSTSESQSGDDETFDKEDEFAQFGLEPEDTD
jgi:hypothetical protein